MTESNVLTGTSLTPKQTNLPVLYYREVEDYLTRWKALKLKYISNLTPQILK